MNKEEIDKLQSIPLTNRMKDLTNQKKGSLLFLKPAEKQGYRTYWWALCDCGNVEKIRSDSPKQSCTQCAYKKVGEKNKGKKALDLTNKKFGKLTALYMLDERQNNRILWHCKCDCGNELDIISTSLTSGNTKSCGCLKKEKCYFAQNKENLVGQKFGKLTVLEETSQRQYEKIVWKCQCDCGNIVFLNTTRLKNGNDISCGCIKTSYGVKEIINILDKNNYSYKKEFSFNDFKARYFDFAIFDQNNQLIRLIEFDGEQHYKITGGWNDKDHFLQNKKRDEEKNNYCKEHNIPLVRIPYWERNNITLELLMGNKYLVK